MFHCMKWNLNDYIVTFWMCDRSLWAVQDILFLPSPWMDPYWS
jgi:hypothetical protein